MAFGPLAAPDWTDIASITTTRLAITAEYNSSEGIPLATYQNPPSVNEISPRRKNIARAKPEHIAKNQKKLKHMVRQAKLRSYKTSPKYMFGFQIPRNYAEALKLDEQNGNTRWQDCTKLELQQLQGYKCFRDQGK